MRVLNKLNSDLENELFLLREQEAMIKPEIDAFNF
jgi:hypothetical protein